MVRMDRIEQAKREVRLNNWQRMYEESLARGRQYSNGAPTTT